ncbi:MULTISPECIES: DnaJ C-terminal domain-containing protein [unclassified Variovorax]|uniref:DnaJ C-terminal domain-containing protein n=1 Tax=unclassified Variovorax TaxID=663243 RepID=UPI00076C8981|nr:MULTISPECIES: DnaJ C-terminal domain-containing protein [unclassified Variovorax]KWT95812.1 Chaperone protein DnaJ [Variovorax sp. WDL1]PNG58844.1 Chaperone protein DnaJ [Variovorax sp. B4]PNG61366.1 Chaperone protein DnaJ [Variovorax sp. B2]VTV12635.1 Heat shock protein J [Variovorax sp. WDL1]
MGTDDAFAELGLASGASEREVKAAWRRLASQWHPDRNGSADAVARMQRINQAFEEIRRAGFLAAPEAPADADAPVSTDPGPAFDDHEGDAAAFRDGAGTARQRRPIHRKVKLTLEEAAAGCIKVLRGKVTETCRTCAGAGHQVLGGHCVRCGGSGAVPKRSFFGWPSGLVECEACLGGGIARQPCAACRSTGKTAPRSYQVKVRIPHGVRDGDLLHVDGRRLRPERLPADLEIRVELLDHAFFKLDDDGTLRCEVPVDGFAWIAGKPLQVPTLTGLQSLQLSRGRLSYCLKGQGFPLERRGARGDQWVTLVPVFPEQLSTDQQILLDQLCATTAGAGGVADDRLQAWQRGLRAWERGMRG